MRPTLVLLVVAAVAVLGLASGVEAGKKNANRALKAVPTPKPTPIPPTSALCQQ